MSTFSLASFIWKIWFCAGTLQKILVKYNGWRCKNGRVSRQRRVKSSAIMYSFPVKLCMIMSWICHWYMCVIWVIWAFNVLRSQNFGQLPYLLLLDLKNFQRGHCSFIGPKNFRLEAPTQPTKKRKKERKEEKRLRVSEIFLCQSESQNFEKVITFELGIVMRKEKRLLFFFSQELSLFSLYA